MDYIKAVYFNLINKCKKTEYHCLEHQGRSNRSGHIQININGSTVGAHRFIWAYFNGPIPEGKQVNHSCSNPRCLNISHLYLGDKSQNVKDIINHDTFMLEVFNTKTDNLRRREERKKIRNKNWFTGYSNA